MPSWRARLGLDESRPGSPGTSNSTTHSATHRLRLGRALLTCLLVAGGFGIAGSVQARRALAQPDCRSVAIRSPFAGDVLSGTVSILGSARIDAFQFYKLEWALEAEPESWRAVSTTIDQPLSNGRLDVWDTQALPDGRYRLKLTAVDQQSGERCRALVAPLWLANSATPEATEAATPLPSVTAIPRQRPAGPGAGVESAAEAEATDTTGSEATPLDGDSDAGEDSVSKDDSISEVGSNSDEDSNANEDSKPSEDPATSPQEEGQAASDAEASTRSEGEALATADAVASPGPMVAGGEALAEAGGSFFLSASIGFAVVLLALLGLALVWLVLGRRGP